MRQFSNPDASSNISGSAHTIPTGRRPRVLFDAFNLEATSDDIQEEAKVEYNADKKPAKVIVFFPTLSFSVLILHSTRLFYQGILRKTASSRDKHGNASQGSDSDALWTAGSR
jgi:hypothetical protein